MSASHDPLHQLIDLKLRHQRWSLDVILATSSRLSPEAFTREIGIGPGSLRATLAHVIECLDIFAAGLLGEPHTTPQDWPARTATPDLAARELARADARLRDALKRALASPAGLDTPIVLSFMDGTPLPLATVIAEIFDHATHHRAQCIHMLKRLGVEKLPGVDPIHFHFSA